MATASPDRTSICFGAFELDLQLGVLKKNGIRLRCQEQPLQVLAALAARPGELVTREELRRRVWPQDTFVDFDHALNTAIKKIRATLSDDADSPRYIETVPRRGYRFVARVEEGAVFPAAAPQAPAKPPPWLLLVGVPALALGIVGFVWRIGPWRHSEASSSPEFQRLTFDRLELGDARFTPDGASVVYSVGGHSLKAEILVQRVSTPSAQSLGIADSVLLAVSRQGELAVLDERSKPTFEVSYRNDAGTLARVSPEASGPRQLLPDVEGADWSLDGQLAVVRRIGHRSRLEYPIGKVLYESSGWIASPRFSPSGNAIAFLDHPVVPDDRGTVIVVDLKGGKKNVSGFWESLRGLAWSPHGDEIWFAAARSGISRALYAVTLKGQERRVLSVAGGLSLKDVSPDGRVLLARDSERLGIQFVGAGEKEPRDLSWKDWSLAMDISHDGKQLLFDEEGENSGFSYQVGLRPTDGSPPVILGPGIAESLSPDGKWALSILPPPNDQLVLLPIGAGNPKPLERGTVEHYEFAGAKWFPDSRQVVFVGYESGHGSRCYMQNIAGGGPRPITPEGVVFCSASPNGSILSLTEDYRALLYEARAKPEKEFKLAPGEIPSGWDPEGKYLYISALHQKPASVVRLEIASGHRQLWKQILPPPENMQIKSGALVITPDGQSYAYTYCDHTSDLYLVQGLR